MHPDWARSLRDQCVAAAVPFLFKQWGEWAPADAVPHTQATTRGLTGTTPHGGHRRVTLDRDGAQRSTNDLTTFFIPADWADLVRVGKKAAGRELDGRTWDEHPSEEDS